MSLPGQSTPLPIRPGGDVLLHRPRRRRGREVPQDRHGHRSVPSRGHQHGVPEPPGHVPLRRQSRRSHGGGVVSRVGRVRRRSRPSRVPPRDDQPPRRTSPPRGGGLRVSLPERRRGRRMVRDRPGALDSRRRRRSDVPGRAPGRGRAGVSPRSPVPGPAPCGGGGSCCYEGRGSASGEGTAGWGGTPRQERRTFPGQEGQEGFHGGDRGGAGAGRPRKRAGVRDMGQVLQRGRVPGRSGPSTTKKAATPSPIRRRGRWEKEEDQERGGAVRASREEVQGDYLDYVGMRSERVMVQQ
mmetsp:Transcript_42118/g.127784  ORF Transcript_42118/g.127784 Transcript_42118/m.127784 type:complete len:297 (-) Transcript_42118:167-1057(-)